MMPVHSAPTANPARQRSTRTPTPPQTPMVSAPGIAAIPRRASAMRDAEMISEDLRPFRSPR